MSIISWIEPLGLLSLVTFFVLLNLHRGASAAGLSNSLRARLVWSAAAVLAAWAVIDIAVASNGLFHYSPAHKFPFLAVAIMGPLAIGALLLNYVRPLRAAVSAIPQYQLVGMHAPRILGVAFLVLMLQRVLPPVFAIPAGIGDMLVGVFAIVLARGLRDGKHSLTAATFGWNLAGIADFVTALSIGFFASTTPFQLIHVTPPTDVNTALPLVMIPIFCVPLYLLVHGLSLSRLRGYVSLGHTVRSERSASTSG